MSFCFVGHLVPVKAATIKTPLHHSKSDIIKIESALPSAPLSSLVLASDSQDNGRFKSEEYVCSSRPVNHLIEQLTNRLS